MKKLLKLIITCSIPLMVASCSDSHQHGQLLNETERANLLIKVKGLFDPDSTVVGDALVPCTLSGGTETECFTVTVTALQTEHKTGPWCPRNISDEPEQSGIWLNDGKAYDADGQFIKNLAEFYNDKDWQLFNPETGEIKVTDSKEACVAAARPDVDPKYQNYCVECLPSYVEEQEEITYLIPANPVYMGGSQSGNPHSGLGLAFNGVKFDAPAPVDAILGAHTLAPFDDCGGHVNPHAGYHYHAVTGCTKEVSSIQDHAPSIGYAMDGFMIHSHLNVDGSLPANLDVCGGHDLDGIGYHYHANEAGKNQIIGCFQAEQGCGVTGDSDSCEVSDRRPPPPFTKQ